MQRRALLAAVGIGVAGSVGGCLDDEDEAADDPDVDAIEEQFEDELEGDDDAGAGDDDAGDDEPGGEGADDDEADDADDAGTDGPEAVVAAYFEAATAGDVAAVDARTYDGADDLDVGGELDAETRELLVGGAVDGVIEWDDAEAIRGSTTTSESGAASIIEDRDADRAAVREADPAIDDLAYVFAVVSEPGGDELVFTAVVVAVDGEWLVADPGREV